MLPALAHVDTWIFDLDNTLYPASTNLFARIDARMTDYVARLLGLPHDQAYALQKRYYFDHGTTLAGLMALHGVDPQHFLDDVHAVELDVVQPDPVLAARIAALPGRKLVFTNGDTAYAERVLDKRGLGGVFESVCDILATGLIPKPDPRAYATLCADHRVTPETALFAEDLARNLAPAKAIGMATLWIDGGSEQPPADAVPDYIDFTTHDLSHWLAQFDGEPQ
ncbi:pyrimidine 5'-nucleotidase [Sphingomonas sp. CJ99]